MASPTFGSNRIHCKSSAVQIHRVQLGWHVSPLFGGVIMNYYHQVIISYSILLGARGTGASSLSKSERIEHLKRMCGPEVSPQRGRCLTCGSTACPGSSPVPCDPDLREPTGHGTLGNGIKTFLELDNIAIQFFTNPHYFSPLSHLTCFNQLEELLPFK